jgi:GAF domain-containing protein
MGSSSQSQSGASRLSVLNEIALALSGELDRRRLYEGIVQGARRLLAVPVAVTMSWDPARSELTTEASTCDGASDTLPLSEVPTCVARAITERTTVAAEDFEAQPRARRFLEAPRLGAAAAIPLMSKGTPLGVLFVAHHKAEPIDIGTAAAAMLESEDLRLLEVLAGHMAFALANAEIVASATRRLARAEELAVVFRGIMEARDREVIVARALDCATTILGADRAAVYLLGGEQRFTMIAGRRLSRHYLEAAARLYWRSVGNLASTARAPAYVPDLCTDPRSRVMHDYAAAEGVHTLLLVPILYRDHLLGAIGLYHDLVWSYEPEDIAPVRQLADHVALALTDCALAQQTQRQLAELQVLEAVVRGTSEPVSELERQTRAASAIVSGGGAERVWVFGADPGGALSLAAHAGRSGVLDEFAAAAARVAARERQAVRHPAPPGEPLVAAPVVFHDEVLGALVLSPPRPLHVDTRPGTVQLLFDGDGASADARLEFASTAAGQLAHAIAHARLLSEATLASGRLEAVLTHMPCGVLVYDKNSRIVFHNALVLEAYGLGETDVTGWGADEWARATAHCFGDADTPRRIGSAIVDHHTEGVRRLEVEIFHPQRRVMERTACRVRTAGGEVLGQVVLYHDVTELRDAQSRLAAGAQPRRQKP